MTELKHTLEEGDQRNTECCDWECGLMYVVNIASLMVAARFIRLPLWLGTLIIKCPLKSKWTKREVEK